MKAARYIHGELLWERSVLVIFHPELPRIHINGDIAYAVAAYYLVTEDREFLADMGGGDPV